MSEQQVRPKVLIVDDRPENLLALNMLLKPLHIEVIQAQSGEEALAQVLRHRFAIILLDVQMPIMDGFETAQLIRANKATATTPIIFVTAISKEDKHISMGYDSGAVDYLYKPINPDILLGKVKVFLQLEYQRLEMQELTERLQETNKTNQLLLSSAGEGIIGITPKGIVEFVNPAATELMQIDEKELKGQSVLLWFYDPGLDTFIEQWQDDKEAAPISRQSCHMRRQTGDSKPVELNLSPMCNAKGNITGGVLMFRDITDRVQLEEHLRQMAQYDNLTGLANRSLFMEFLQNSLTCSEEHGRMMALLFLDLDHFKQINDTLGHDVGDDLLISVAKCLHDCIGESDLIARLGGDEFAIVLNDVASIDDVKQVASKIVESISKPHKLSGRDLHVGASVGIVTSNDCGQNPTELIKAADTAMYVTKKTGRHGFRFFTQSMQVEGQQRAQQEHSLREAVRKGQFDLIYQPMVALDSGKVVAYETQLTWSYNNVLLGQGDFLPMVESLHLMNELGRWTLDSVGREVSTWCEDSEKRQKIVFSVNLTVSQCQSAEIATLVEQILEKYNLKPSQLELGISERIVGDASDKLITALNRLRELGVHIALDNFGSGVSALNYLRKLPIDVIKVDQLYIREISQDDRVDGILKALTRLAHDMGIRAVAKGVESSEQLQLLTQLGYDRAQGSLLGQPESITSIGYNALGLHSAEKHP